jgi:hypothetical protein
MVNTFSSTLSLMAIIHRCLWNLVWRRIQRHLQMTPEHCLLSKNRDVAIIWILKVLSKNLNIHEIHMQNWFFTKLNKRTKIILKDTQNYKCISAVWFNAFLFLCMQSILSEPEKLLHRNTISSARILLISGIVHSHVSSLRIEAAKLTTFIWFKFNIFLNFPIKNYASKITVEFPVLWILSVGYFHLIRLY